MGSDSYDPDGGTLEYLWAVDDKPLLSTLTAESFVDVTSMNPLIVIDQAGTYTFSLTVFDGLYSSEPSRLTLEIMADPSDVEGDTGAAE
jgi:hypothetical protein